MTSKIDFYREVLSDDPNSRVFFPLAKLLAREGSLDEAVEVLGKSIPFHPAHLEAKFLLVELLTRLGRDEEAGKQFEGLVTLLSDYPSVWRLWAAKAPGLTKDAALALKFFALSLAGGEVSLSGILEKGLAASGSKVGGEGGEPAEAPEAFSLRGAQEVMALTQRIEAQERRAQGDSLPPECGAASTAEVKTRTMAELLARHGDYSSALEIYGQLHRLSSNPQEKQALALRIDEIESLMASGGVPRQQEVPREIKSKAKLVSMLEALANRLDARATA